ncbi:MAG: UDP-3-O-(3-hydroxymyristoyl)glucosamine N-acyltransferase [Proteobacteria bacterium]|nr:UDP-3-O-(3-hydroxymyristoyl)glucosamine N-acyltransferase [Pseudomonadota bacterium]
MQLNKTLSELAHYLHAELKGDGACIISGIAPLHSAKNGDIAFLDNPRYRKYLSTTEASAVIVSSAFSEKCVSNALIVEDPYYAYAKVAELFDRAPKPKSGIHPTALIAPDAQIASSASIGPYAVIESGVVIGSGAVIGAHCAIGENVHIGENTRLWSHVTVYYDVTIGNRVNIHSGVVIGADGFGIANHKGKWLKVPQLGSVLIADDVDIGANTTIDRGAITNTIIGEGVKLDNQIQIGHNVEIGAHTAIAGCVGIAGSTKIGKYCLIGGGSCIAGHLEIADKVVITGMSGISSSLTESGMYSSGVNVQLTSLWRRNVARFHQLDDMAKRILILEKLVKNTEINE